MKFPKVFTRPLTVAQQLEIGLFLALYLLYGLHVSPGGGVNPNRYFDLTHSLVDQGTLWIDAYHENTVDKAFRAGHYYSAGFPGPSLLGIPAYLAFKAVYALTPEAWLAPVRRIQSFQQGSATGFYAQDTTAFFLSTIWLTWFTLAPLAALSAVWLLRVLQRLGIGTSAALVATLVYALGTPVFFFSTVYYAHVFAAVFVIGGLELLTRWPRPTNTQTLWVGLVVGLSALMEAQGLVLSAVFGLYVLARHGWRAAVFYALGIAGPLAGLALYNTLAFGGPLEWSYKYMVGYNYSNFHTAGYLGFTLPRPERLWGLTFSFARGIFWYAPALLLAGLGWWRALRGQTPTRDRLLVHLTWVGTALIFAYVASFEAWNGSVTFGPRLNLCALPFMVVGMAWGLTAVPKPLAGGLVALSLFINWLGAQYGEAESAWQHWPTFFQQGPQLPALGVILTHSTSANPFLSFVTAWAWAIYALYFALLIALGLWLWRASQMRSPISQ